MWLVHNPTADTPGAVSLTKYASGLHEALGIWAQDDATAFVRDLFAQRPVDSDIWVALAWCVAITFASYLWARALYRRDPTR